MPKHLDLSGIPAPKRPMSEEEIGKAYIESMIALPVLLQSVMEQLIEMSSSLSILALYYEKKGLTEALFTDSDLTGDDNEQ